MTKDAALNQYFNKFMTSYPNTSVPDDAELPWMTYEYIDGSFGDAPVSITVNMWFRSESEALPNENVRALRKYIENNDLIKCDEGYLWIRAGAPWSQAIVEDDTTIKRRYINMTIEFLTR